MQSKSRKKSKPLQPGSAAPGQPTAADARHNADKPTTTKDRVRKRRPPFVL